MDILSNSQSSTEPYQLSLLDLNDDCLLEIMSYLSIEDLTFISMGCRRLENIAQYRFPRQLKLWNDKDVETSNFFLSKIGEFLTKIEVADDYFGHAITMNETMKLLKRNCTNLQSIILRHFIPNYLPDWRTPLEHLDDLKYFTELESLTLTFMNSTMIDGSFLLYLPHLKQLKLENCSVELVYLQNFLRNSEATLRTLSLMNCFEELPHALISNIEQLDTLSELELQLKSIPESFSRSNLFHRLTSLTLANCSVAIDVDHLFYTLIEHNKIQEISFSSVISKAPLNHYTTVLQLHRLTNLRRLYVAEDDFLTDVVLAEISKGRNLTHFSYYSSYRPLLSFDAFIALNGPSIQTSKYNVFHDILLGDPKSESKKELMAAYRKTVEFKRVSQCKEIISRELTFVEFLFKNKHVKLLSNRF